MFLFFYQINNFIFTSIFINFILQLSEFFNKVLSNPSNIFKAFDFVVKGKVPFPRQNVDFFRYYAIFPVGPIVIVMRKLL